MKAIFMGTPEFSIPSLKKLLDLNIDVELVITQQDKVRGRGKKLQYTHIKEFALENNLEVYQPENVNSLESIEKIKNINPDIIVVVAYGQILKEDILNMPKIGCINVHASLLPKYRGAAPINWVLINGEEKTGITIMRMEKGLDTGNILYTKEIDIEDKYDSGILHDILKEMGGEALGEFLKEYEKGNILEIKQDENISSYAHMINKSLGHIKWTKGEDIKNLIRGTQPWPGSFFYYKGDLVKVKSCDIIEKSVIGKIGEIIDVTNKGLYVQSKDSILLFRDIQFPGKKMMSVSDYIKGNQIEKGIILN